MGEDGLTMKRAVRSGSTRWFKVPDITGTWTDQARGRLTENKWNINESRGSLIIEPSSPFTGSDLSPEPSSLC